MDAGLPAKYYSDLKYIVHDEEAHVLAISAALMAAGVTPNAACTYKFPFTDVCVLPLRLNRQWSNRL